MAFDELIVDWMDYGLFLRVPLHNIDRMLNVPHMAVRGQTTCAISSDISDWKKESSVGSRYSRASHS